MCNAAHCKTLAIVGLKNPSKYKKENKNLLKNVLSCLGLHDRPSHVAALQEDQKNL